VGFGAAAELARRRQETDAAELSHLAGWLTDLLMESVPGRWRSLSSWACSRCRLRSSSLAIAPAAWSARTCAWSRSTSVGGRSGLAPGSGGRSGGRGRRLALAMAAATSLADGRPRGGGSKSFRTSPHLAMKWAPLCSPMRVRAPPPGCRPGGGRPEPRARRRSDTPSRAGRGRGRRPRGRRGSTPRRSHQPPPRPPA
jgi:hypothetical protein